MVAHAVCTSICTDQLLLPVNSVSCGSDLKKRVNRGGKLSVIQLVYEVRFLLSRVFVWILVYFRVKTNKWEASVSL